MRILALSSWWPEPADNGSRLRIAHLLRALAHEHEVHLVAFTQGSIETVRRAEIDRICASVRLVRQQKWTPRRVDRIASLFHRDPAYYRALWSEDFAAMVRQRATAICPEAVVAFELNSAPYAYLVPSVPRLLDELQLAYLLDHFTQQPLHLRRLRAWLTWAKHRAYVGRMLAGFDACTVVSPREERLVRRVGGANLAIAVIPNGADVAGCEQIREQPEPDTLIYPGALTFEANLDAMRYFVGEIWPLVQAVHPGALLRITGQAEAEHHRIFGATPGVKLTGFVPDVRSLIAGSWAEVVPLRRGGGTRLKILEALALGTPVISTSKGVEGLHLHHGKDLLVADTPAEFAAATTLLLGQPTLRASLVESGQRAVRQYYDWRVIGACLSQLLIDLAGRSTYAHSAA